MPEPSSRVDNSDEMNSSSMPQVYRHIPEELLETVLEYFFKNTKPTLKNRAAILSTCKAWRRIAEPFLWKHIAVIDNKRELPKFTAFTRVLNDKPAYGQLIESFSLSVGDYVKEDVNISDRRKITSLMKNVKSVSISIERFFSEDMCEALKDIVKLLVNIPRSCEALYFKIGVMDDVNDWMGMPALPCTINHICKQVKTARLEVPPILLSSLFTGHLDTYPMLESLVTCWTFMLDLGCDEDDGGWYSCRNFLIAVARGKVPNLKKALIVKPPTNIMLKDWLRRLRFINRVESDLKFDSLLEDSLVIAYDKTPPASLQCSEKTKVELQKSGAVDGVNKWSLNVEPSHTSMQPRGYEFKTFEYGESIIFDIVLKDKDLAWAKPLNGGQLPWQMATEFELVEEAVDQCVGAETLEEPFNGALLLSVNDSH